jgi:hypothetical protein
VPLRKLVDVALVARLGPAALVVPARNVVRLFSDLDEPAVAQAEDPATLASDDRDECPVAADVRGKRSERELDADPSLALQRLGERHRAPKVVERGGEDGNAPGASPAVEAVVEPAAYALEISLQRITLLV